MDKVVLITGCSSGLGLESAKYLAEKGYTVIPTVRKEKDIVVLPLAIQLDVTWKQERIDKLIAEVIKRYGRIDCLVNNAGYGYQGLVENAEEVDVRDQFETNFIGVFKVIKAVLPYMKREKKGLIINVSSILGLISIPKYGIYSASKFAIEAMSKALRYEEENTGLKVVVINPGGFKTYFNKNSLFNNQKDADRKSYGYEPIEFAKLVEKIINTDEPKNNYIIGGEAASIRFIRFLPEFLREVILKKYFSRY